MGLQTSDRSTAECTSHSATDWPVSEPIDKISIEGRAEDEKQHEDQEPPSDKHDDLGWARLTIIGIGIWLNVFLYSLDQTIVSNAIPSITDEFNSTLDQGWYGSSYLLTTSAFQLLYGRIYSGFSIKYTLLTSISIFELGSLICGVAPTSNALIAGRAIAGVGCAGIAAGSFTVIGHVFPLHVRPLCIASLAIVFAVAAVLGPVLGGIFTTNLTWRWCFYINLPFGGVAMAGLFVFLPPLTSAQAESVGLVGRLKKLDIVGFLLFVPAVVCLLLALEWGGSTYAWTNSRIIALFVLFGVLCVAFVAFERFKGREATLPMHIITRRSVAAAAWNAFCNGAAFFLLIYYIPVWQQVIRNDSATTSGVGMLPFVLGAVIMAIVVGAVVTKVGYFTPFMIISTVIAPIGEGLMTTWTVNTSSSHRIGYQALAGIGMGIGQQQPQVAVQAILPKADIPVGASIVVLVQTISGAIFIAVGQAVIQSQLSRGLKVAFPNGNVTASSVSDVGVTNIRALVPPEDLPAVLVAYNKALTDVFTVALVMSALTFFGSLSMEWKSVKKAKVQQS